MAIASLDHAAIPIANVDAMLEFYRALGFEVKTGGLDGLTFYSVHFGEQRFNFHHPDLWQSQQFDLRAPRSVPGCGDFCFVWDENLATLYEFLLQRNIDIELGPVSRSGGRAQGEQYGQSIYIRDPDANLLEFLIYPNTQA